MIGLVTSIHIFVLGGFRIRFLFHTLRRGWTRHRGGWEGVRQRQGVLMVSFAKCFFLLYLISYNSHHNLFIPGREYGGDSVVAWYGHLARERIRVS